MTGGGGAGLKRRFAVLGLIFALAGLVAAWSWWQRRDIETTDDAFIEADILRVSPLVGGTAISVHFIDNARVEKGALLIEIDPADYRHRVAEARARHAAAEARVRAAEAALDLVRKTATAGVSQASSGLDQARKLVTQARSQLDATRAEADRADAEIRRVEDLFKGGTASRQRLDQAIADAKTAGARREAGQAAVAAAEAQVALAQAKLAEAGAAPEHIALREAELATSLAQSEETRSILGSAELDLARTRIVAPMSGRIAKKAVVPGDTVQRGQVLAALVGTETWVVANFKETQIARMRSGQPVKIRVDAFPDIIIEGRVEAIQPGTGSRFSLLPAENATGNYVKVVQRVPVRIVFDPASSLAGRLVPGMSVVPEVHVGAGTPK